MKCRHLLFVCTEGKVAVCGEVSGVIHRIQFYSQRERSEWAQESKVIKVGRA